MLSLIGNSLEYMAKHKSIHTSQLTGNKSPDCAEEIFITLSLQLTSVRLTKSWLVGWIYAEGRQIIILLPASPEGTEILQAR